MSGPNPIERGLPEEARKLFAGEVDFKWGADTIEDLPPMGLPEIAFAGRSNVGKSSLVNALTGRKTLARTSHTPGRTQQLNYFNVGDRFMLVDMPGYGYAAVGKEKVAKWNAMLRAYLRGRANLYRVYVLIDARHGVKPNDAEMLDMLDEAAVSYALVLTKADELKKSEIEPALEAARAVLAKRPAAFPEIILTSSETGEGISDLREAVVRLLRERGK